jgi:DNA-binding XRE family transcriptional regulator
MKTWSDIKARKMSPERIARIRREAQGELRALTLRQLREEAGKTQVEMAEIADLTQSALSRIERREDNPIEALRRYVEALGGELEVVAIIGNKRVKLLGV